MEENKSTRRKFLQNLAFWIIGGTTAVSLFPVIGFLLPRKEKKGINLFTDSNGNPIPAKSIEEGEYKLGLSREGPTIVIKREKALYAFSAVCTHLGCIVKWIPAKAEFLCPCHAGRFDANGVVISGPPPKPLKRYRVEVSPEDLIVLT